MFRNKRLQLAVALCMVAQFSFGASLFCDTNDSMAVFASHDIAAALSQSGDNVSAIQDLNALAAGSGNVRIVLAKKGAADIDAALTAAGGAAVGALKTQGYALRITTSGAGKTYWVIGADGPGVMYGGLDLAQSLLYGDAASLANGDHAPYIQDRGLKYDIALDCRCPTYGEAGDAEQLNIANVWDFNFWRDFLDRLARYHINLVVLWTQNPFPVLVKVPEYPNASLNDVMQATIPYQGTLQGMNLTPASMLQSAKVIKTMTIDEKIAHWQKVMQYGAERGVRFMLNTYNLHVYSLENKYGITASESNATTTDYFRKAVRTLFLTYPNLAGISTYWGEGGRVSFGWLWNTYGRGIMDAKSQQPGRKIKFVMRVSTPQDVSDVYSAFAAFTDSLDCSVRYSRGRMWAYTAPTEANSMLSALPAGKRSYLELRNEDLFMMRYGDPDFMRAYIQSMPLNKASGFLYGSNGYEWAREIVSRYPDSPRQLACDKFWYLFMMLGRLGYDPTLSDSFFKKALAYKFPGANTNQLFAGWASASKVFERLDNFMFSKIRDDFDFYPEGCNAWNNAWISRSFFSGLTGGAQAATDLKTDAAAGLADVSALYPGNDKELCQTLTDIKAMSALGNYYAEKISGTNLQAAAKYWRQYATLLGAQYKNEIISRLGSDTVSPMKFMANVQGEAGAAAASAPPTAGGVILEAETAQASGAAVQSSLGGFTGTGYVSANSTNAKITWTYNAAGDGLYPLEFRYSINSGDIPTILTVNGAEVCPPLSVWTTGTAWQNDTRLVHLTAGPNTITIQPQGAGALFDHVNILTGAVTSLSPTGSAGKPEVRVWASAEGLRVNVLLPAASRVDISVFDYKGSLVRIIKRGMQAAGRYAYALDSRSMDAGVYFCKAKVGNMQTVRRFVLSAKGM